MIRCRLGLDVTLEYISCAHRLKSKRGSTNLPIIVQFNRRSVRDDIYYSRFKLNTFNQAANAALGIYINEDLFDQNRKLFADARSKVRTYEIQSVNWLPHPSGGQQWGDDHASL